MAEERVTTSSQDYLEAILLLSKHNEGVRSVDIAGVMAVSRASVNKALGVLREKGLVEQERYGTVCLTDEGVKVAGAVMSRHLMLKEFLSGVLGVCPETAEKDACRMEHAISPETMERLSEFMKNIKD